MISSMLQCLVRAPPRQLKYAIIFIAEVVMVHEKVVYCILNGCRCPDEHRWPHWPLDKAAAAFLLRSMWCLVIFCASLRLRWPPDEMAVAFLMHRRLCLLTLWLVPSPTNRKAMFTAKIIAAFSVIKTNTMKLLYEHISVKCSRMCN